MKFNEKLQKLRKDAQLSQEELAEKLEVSRQAVSKWESGTTYPEMDKLISLTKIFNCTLDDLTNDTISTEVISTKQKNGIYNLIDSALDLIDQTLLLLKRMTAIEIVWMLLKLVVIGAFLMLGYIPFSVLINLGHNIFYALPQGLDHILSSIWSFILVSSFVLLYIMVFVYLFKKIYLDAKEDEVIVVVGETSEEEKADKTVEVKQRKRFERTDSFFMALGNVIMFLAKCLMAMFVLLFVLLSVCVFILLALEVALLFNGVIYFGALILTVSAVCVLYSIIIVMTNIIFNRANNYQLFLRLFLASISCLGIGTGILTLEIANTKFVDVAPVSFVQKTVNKEFAFTDDLVIVPECRYQYVVDDNLNNTIKMEITYYEDTTSVDVVDIEGKTGTVVKYVRIYSDMNQSFHKLFSDIITGLRSKKIYNYGLLNEALVTFYGTQSNLDKLETNLDKHRVSVSEGEYTDYAESLQFEIDYLSNELAILQDENNELELQNEELKSALEELKERIKGILEE